MGYRSCVAMMLYGKPGEVDMVVNMLQAKLDPYYERDLFERNVTSSLTEWNNQTIRTVTWEFNDIKWYSELDNYREAIFSWVDSITEEQEPPLADNKVMLACDFVRIGEQNDDVEEHYSQYSDYRLQVVRRITIDGA